MQSTKAGQPHQHQQLPAALDSSNHQCSHGKLYTSTHNSTFESAFAAASHLLQWVCFSVATPNQCELICLELHCLLGTWRRHQLAAGTHSSTWQQQQQKQRLHQTGSRLVPLLSTPTAARATAIILKSLLKNPQEPKEDLYCAKPKQYLPTVQTL
jgi:hypothetical protein